MYREGRFHTILSAEDHESSEEGRLGCGHGKPGRVWLWEAGWSVVLAVVHFLENMRYRGQAMRPDRKRGLPKPANFFPKSQPLGTADK